MEAVKEFETNLAYHFSEVLEYPIAKPYWIYISPSHRCTYECQMCGVVKILKGYELPKEAITKALDEISQWKRDCNITLTGGEPFLRNDIFEIINYAAKKNIPVETVSNGALIDRDLAKRIISSGLWNIAISLDGACEPTHEFIRKKGAFKKAISAIVNLVEAKRKYGSDIQISTWATIMRENVSELSDIIPLVRDLGVECLVYHPVMVAQDDMQNNSPNAPFWIKGDDLIILKEQIDAIIDYKNKYGLVAFLHDPYLWIKHFDGRLTKNYWKCNPFVFINIGPDGEVRSCGASFGNIKDASLNECLMSEEAFAARALMKICQKPCLQTCWAHPDSDSLVKIAGNFINNIKHDKDKARLLKAGIKLLEKYKNTAINYRNA